MSLDEPTSQADDTANVLKELLDDAAGKPGLPQELIQNLREKVDNDTLMVAILALVKAGKSTLMNAMVGQEFLPSMPEPETAVLVQVRHDPAFPQGKLFNMEGTLVSEGRTEIMDFLRAQNRKRRDLALNMEKEKQMAVQKQLEDALSKPVTGNFETANGVTKLFIRRIPNGQMWMCIQIRKSRRSGVLTGPCPTSGGYMVNTFNDRQRHFDSPQQIKIRFDGTGITFQRRHNSQSAWDDAQVAKKVISEAPTGLYARCIRGRWVKGMLFRAEDGVEHRYTSDEFSGEKGTYCLVGTTFFVYAISRFMIKDCNGWMNKFDMTGEPQFEFVYDHDLIEGQPVRIKDHDPSVPIGIIEEIEGQKARVAFHDGPHDVSLDDLAPVPTCETCTFMVQSAPNTPQAVPFLGKTYNITIPPDKIRGCFLSVWVETSVRSGSKNDDEVGEETKLEADSFLLRVPVKAFALPELKSAMNFELMDTPGPNEAHAHLQTELRTSLKKADVILYVLDYTKLATSDEKDMFETLKTYASAMLTSVDTRFWFVLNKVDAMKVDQDMETVKKSVADRINLMCEDIKVSPHQILPISALHGFLGRQGQNAQRVSEDRVFVKEFLKRAFTMYEEMYPDPADWPGLVTQFAPALIRKSMMLNLEKTVFLKVVQVKAQLLGETVCDQLSNALVNSSNVVQVELASLQASQSDIEVRLSKFDEVKTELSDRLKLVTHQVAQANHFESFVKTVNKYFTQMKSEVTEIVNELFSTAPPRQVKSRLKTHLNMFGDKKKIQAINERFRIQAEKKIKEQDEKMSALMEAAYKQCTQDISDALADEFEKLQSTLRKLCQPVLDSMMQRTGQSMDVTLRRSILSFSKNKEIDFAKEMSKQQKAAQMMKEKKVQKDRVKEEVKTWHLLWFIPTPFTWTDRKVTKEMVTESYNVDLSILKQRWVKWIDNVSENMKQTAATTISSMITEEVQRVSREIKEKCNSVVATVCKSQAQFGGDKKALAARTSELVALNDVLQELIEKTNKVWTSLVDQNSEEDESPSVADKSLSSFLQPLTGPMTGCTEIRWIAGEPLPGNIKINGQNCDDLGKGVFMLPCLVDDANDDCSTAVDVEVQMDGTDTGVQQYPGSFIYYGKGRLESVSPSEGPVTGGTKLLVTTTPLGADITKVCVGGLPCEIDMEQPPTDTKAIVTLPAKPEKGSVEVEVQASNGNSATADNFFNYYIPSMFGLIGEHVLLSNNKTTATRERDVTGGICIGEFPIQAVDNNRYFEIFLAHATTGSTRTLAVGFAAGHGMKLTGTGRILATEASELDDVWLAGYDKDCQAKFISNTIDNAPEQCDPIQKKSLPIKAWRPLTDLKSGMCIQAWWSQPQAKGTAHFMVFVDGKQKVKQEVPVYHGELYALVDLQGRVSSVSLVQNPTPPEGYGEDAEEDYVMEEKEEDDDADAAFSVSMNRLKEELQGLKKSELRKRAKAAGVSAEDMDAADDEDDPKELYIELIMDKVSRDHTT